MITLAVLMFLYFLPTIVASERGHRVGGILILNLFLGWTVIGWFALLLWALLARPAWCYVAVPVYRPYYAQPYYGQHYNGQHHYLQPYYGYRRY